MMACEQVNIDNRMFQSVVGCITLHLLFRISHFFIFTHSSSPLTIRPSTSLCPPNIRCHFYSGDNWEARRIEEKKKTGEKNGADFTCHGMEWLDG